MSMTIWDFEYIPQPTFPKHALLLLTVSAELQKAEYYLARFELPEYYQARIYGVHYKAQQNKVQILKSLYKKLMKALETIDE